MNALRVWLGPDDAPELRAAVGRAGGELVAPREATVIVWSARDEDPAMLLDLLHDGVQLVQLDSAGIDHLLDAGLIDDRRAWAAAQGAYADALAEHALALLLAAAKRLPLVARERAWSAPRSRRLAGSTVAVVGAGGIGTRLIELLAPLAVATVAVTRSGGTVHGATRSLGPEALTDALRECDYAVLSAPLTPATARLIGAAELDLIGPEGWLVNVGRGAVVDTDALVEALASGRLGGACLDVTEPEPLPAGHQLWSLPNALVTPHASNPWDDHFAALATRVEENLHRFRDGLPLVGLVERERGY